MKSVYLLVIVSLCQVLPLETRLSAPAMVTVVILDPPAIEVSWNRIDSGEDQDPVVGYKVKMWEVKNTETTKYTDIDGQEEEKQEVPVDMISGPDEILNTAEKTTATYNNLKPDVTYEVRVQAFTKNEDGPMSDPISIMLSEE